MSYETEEQQLEQLKEWWRENGTPLIVGAVLGLGGFGAWKFWNAKQLEYREGASDLYVKVEQIAKTENQEGLEESAEAVKTQFPDSSYAIMSAFLIAKKAVEDEDYDKAANELRWVVDNHKGNDLVSIAQIRLARVLMQQGKPTEALPLLELGEDSGYYSLANLIKGEALMALERNEEALAAFKIANADQEFVARHPSLKFKIDALSSPTPLTTSAEVEEQKSDEPAATTDSDTPAAETQSEEDTVAATDASASEQKTETNTEESK